MWPWLALAAGCPAPPPPAAFVEAAHADPFASTGAIEGFLRVWADADVLRGELAAARPDAAPAALVVRNPWAVPVDVAVDGAPVGVLAAGREGTLHDVPAGTYAVTLSATGREPVALSVATAPSPGG